MDGRCGQAALREDGSNYQAQVFAGVALAKTGKPKDAEKAYRAAIAMQPDEQLAWHVRHRFILALRCVSVLGGFRVSTVMHAGAGGPAGRGVGQDAGPRGGAHPSL